jgi:O-antigen/teichoic acid export membrane protein
VIANQVNVESSNLRQRTVKGVSWSAVAQFVTQSFSWVISIIVARLLGPKAYGLIAMTTVFTGFAMLFSDLGLSAAIVQRVNLEKRHLDTAFWINVVSGFFMTALMAALAPLVATFYHEPRLTWITVVIAFQFSLIGLDVVQQALIRRAMRFRALAGIRITSTAVGGITGLTMAFAGMGVWSLVAQPLCSSLFRVLLLWKAARWRPSLSFDVTAGKELFGFSGYLLSSYIVNYWARNADNLLVGRFIGAQALGVYSRAYTLMLLPLNQVTLVVSQVMTPALCSIQQDRIRVKRSYLKAVSIVALITFPVMTGLFVTSERLIMVLLGKQWIDVIPIFKILCGVGLIQSISGTFAWIYHSQARTALMFRMTVLGSLGCIIAFVIGIRWGVLGVAWAYCIFSLVWWYPVWATCGSIIGLSFAEMVKTVLPMFACAAAMSFLVWGIGRLLPPSMPSWLYLLVQIPAGVLTYVLLVTGLRLDAAKEAATAVKDLFRVSVQTVAEPPSSPVYTS